MLDDEGACLDSTEMPRLEYLDWSAATGVPRLECRDWSAATGVPRLEGLNRRPSLTLLDDEDAYHGHEDGGRH